MFSKTDIEKYFIAEKNLGLLLLIIALVALLAAGIFFFVMKTSWHKGAALAFLLVGLFQLGIGYTVYSHADKQRKAAVYAFDMNPLELKEKELPRLEKAIDGMGLYIAIEIGLMLAGIALFVYFKTDNARLFWAGFGIALAVQAALCLYADIRAKSLATVYKNGLSHWNKSS